MSVLHPDAMIAEELTRENLNQWQWAMEPLTQGARQAFSVAVRPQFTVSVRACDSGGHHICIIDSCVFL